MVRIGEFKVVYSTGNGLKRSFPLTLVSQFMAT